MKIKMVGSTKSLGFSQVRSMLSQRLLMFWHSRKPIGPAINISSTLELQLTRISLHSCKERARLEYFNPL